MQQDVFEQFSLLILKMSKIVQKIKALEMVPFDLKAVHVMILYLLRMHREGLSVSELCRQTMDDKAAVSRAVSVLRERGYVEPEDTRLSPVRLTKEGEELAAYISGRAACAVSEGGVGLSDAEREQHPGGTMIKLLADSACDLEAEEAKARGIALLPLYIRFGDEEFQDGVTLSHRAFFEKLVETDDIPKTSQISEYRFAEAFEELTKDGSEVIAVVLSSKLSGTCQSAVKASKKFEGKVFVVDSMNACLGERILVEYAARLIEEGKLSAREIAAELANKKGKIKLLALLDTLKYLRKGGRISSVTAIAGEITERPDKVLKQGFAVR